MQFGWFGFAEPAKLPFFSPPLMGRGKGRGIPGDVDVALASEGKRLPAAAGAFQPLWIKHTVA
jgi:hypothetical protein